MAWIMDHLFSHFNAQCESCSRLTITAAAATIAAAKKKHKRMEDNVNYYLHSTSPWTSNYKSCLLFLSGFRFLYNSKWIKSPLIIEIQCATIERIQRKKKKSSDRRMRVKDLAKLDNVFSAHLNWFVWRVYCVKFYFILFLHNTNTSAIHMFISYVCELSYASAKMKRTHNSPILSCNDR